VVESKLVTATLLAMYEQSSERAQVRFIPAPPGYAPPAPKDAEPKPESTPEPAAPASQAPAAPAPPASGR
jgi:hypothetical protein